MQKIFIALFIILSQTVYSQVTLSPVIVTQNDTVTITFDATQGSAGLVGVTPVYMHTGVITNLSSSPTSWRHVQGNWGVHDPKVLMTPLGNNKHSIKIHINTFYSVPSNETVSALAFVFRNTDGSKEGKTVSGNDIFVPISQGGYTAYISSHLNAQYFYDHGDTMKLNMVASDPSDIDLSMDGVLIASDTASTSFDFDVLTGNYTVGFHELIMKADNGTQILYDTVTYLSHSGAPIAVIPSYGEEGIFALNDSTMYFQLRAPYIDFAYIKGDFSDWYLKPEYQMNKSPNGQFFWLEITGLDKNIEYGFQYAVEQDYGYLSMADPYCEKVLNPNDDPYIPASVYPNLKAYPYGLTQEIVGVFQIEETQYVWNTPNFTKPKTEELIIYELLVRDFHQDHNYNAVIEKLDYLKSMGTNAIELLPVMEFEGNESWGYNPSFMMAPDKYYGPKNELKRLIDSCHSKGIAVVLDIALNHSFGQNPMVQMYFDHSAGQWGQPTAQSPWFNEVAKHDFNVGYDYNHESAATKYYSKKVIGHWVEEYKIDGYRFDLSKGFTQNNTLGDVNGWGQYDQSRIDIWTDYTNHLWSIDSTSIVILEHFADNSEETVLSNKNMLLWGNENHQYNEATMGYPSNLNGVSHQSRNWSDMHLVGFMESHDEERLMYKTTNFGGSNTGYDTKNQDTALQRMALASAFFYTIPGPKMLWQFGELGYDYSINHCPDGTIKPECRVANKPIRWDYYNEQNRKDLYAIVSELNHLRRTNPVFSFDTNHDLSVNGLRKRIKLSDADLDVVVIGNFDINPGSINPSFHKTGWWYDHFERDSINVTDVNANINLIPGEWHVYTSKPLATAISIDEVEYNAQAVNVYPNPFNDEVHFETLEGQNIDQVTILDNLGRVIFNEDYSAQPLNKVKLDTPNLASGVYIFKVKTSAKTFTGKIIKTN
jgi:1,4-alpha-glucan branching enzyme